MKRKLRFKALAKADWPGILEISKHLAPKESKPMPPFFTVEVMGCTSRIPLPKPVNVRVSLQSEPCPNCGLTLYRVGMREANRVRRITGKPPVDGERYICEGMGTLL